MGPLKGGEGGVFPKWINEKHGEKLWVWSSITYYGIYYVSTVICML